MNRIKPDHITRQHIVNNACFHFGVTLKDLLKDTLCKSLVSKIVMCALYHEANYTHCRAAEVFSNPHPVYCHNAIKLINAYVHDRRPDAGIILQFYKKYGYCKHLWERKAVA